MGWSKRGEGVHPHWTRHGRGGAFGCKVRIKFRRNRQSDGRDAGKAPQVTTKSGREEESEGSTAGNNNVKNGADAPRRGRNQRLRMNAQGIDATKRDRKGEGEKEKSPAL